MGILDLFSNGRKKEYGRIEERLDDLEEILRELNFKTDDKFESVLFGIDAVMPDEKGNYINKLEARICEIKKGMVDGVLLSACAGEPKTYPELRREVRNRTSLNVTGAFLDECLRELSCARKLERIGSRYIASNGSSALRISAPTLVEKSEENAIAGEIAVPRRLKQAESAISGDIVTPQPPSGLAKLEKLEIMLKAVARLEKETGPVPIPRLLEEASREGIDEQTANQLIDEHLMVTGRLYEPKQDHVKLVRPLPI